MMKRAHALTAPFAVAGFASPVSAAVIDCVLSEVGGGAVENVAITVPSQPSKDLAAYQVKGQAETAFDGIERLPIKTRDRRPKSLMVSWERNDPDSGRSREALIVEGFEMTATDTGIARVKAGTIGNVTRKLALDEGGVVLKKGWYLEGQCRISPSEAVG